MFCLDYLGGAKFKSLILAEHPNGWGAGFFSNVIGFGDAVPTIDALLKTGRCPLVRIHLKWKDKHDFSKSDFPSIYQEAKRLIPLINKYPDVEFYISGACEHNLSEADAFALAEHLDSILPPRVFIVNTPLKGKGKLIKKHLNEFHGESEKPSTEEYGFSFDGKNCVDADVEKFKREYKNARYFMFWNCQMNGRKALNDNTPRPKRNAYPNSRQIDSWVYLAQDKGETNFPKPYPQVYKSHSDQHKDKPEGKDQKPVVITSMSVRPTRLVLKAANGQTISTSSVRVAYNEKNADGSVGRQVGWRYYLDDWGYLLADKAKRLQKGNPVCFLWADNKVYAKINPAFRDSTFR